MKILSRRRSMLKVLLNTSLEKMIECQSSFISDLFNQNTKNRKEYHFEESSLEEGPTIRTLFTSNKFNFAKSEKVKIVIKLMNTWSFAA
jgi:hypothetical protein